MKFGIFKKNLERAKDHNKWEVKDEDQTVLQKAIPKERT